MRTHFFSKFLLFLMVSSIPFNVVFITSGNLVNSAQGIDENPNLKIKQTYTPHGPIKIESDVELNQTAFDEGWAGTGTLEDPYIIEYYLISERASEMNWMTTASIILVNINKHVVIRNNRFQCSSAGSDIGVFIALSSNISIINNEITQYNYAMNIFFGENLIIESNIMSHTSNGVRLYNIDNIRMENNLVTNTSSGSISFENLGNFVFKSNVFRFSNLAFWGTEYFSNISNSIFYNNTFDYMKVIINIYSTDNAQITYNKFLHCDVIALYLGNSNFNTITKNLFVNPQFNNNFHLQSSNTNFIYMNNFYCPPAYVHLYSTTTGNQFYNNQKGNYYSTYSGVDANGDGIGDTPYIFEVDGNEDRYPLMEPVDLDWPIITDSPTELTFTTDDTASISWTATDANPTEYKIYQDDVLAKNGTFLNGTTNAELGELSEGAYDYEVVLFDKDNNTASFTTKIIVETVTTTPSDTTEETNTTTQNELFDFISEHIVEIAGVGVVLVVGLFIFRRIFRRKK